MTERERCFITFTILNPLFDAANRALNVNLKFEDFMKAAENAYWETAGCYLDAESRDRLKETPKGEPEKEPE